MFEDVSTRSKPLDRKQPPCVTSACRNNELSHTSLRPTSERWVNLEAKWYQVIADNIRIGVFPGVIKILSFLKIYISVSSPGSVPV